MTNFNQSVRQILGEELKSFAVQTIQVNSALGLTLAGNLPGHIDELESDPLQGRTIVTGEHCFGCTAGCGSSCAGALMA